MFHRAKLLTLTLLSLTFGVAPAVASAKDAAPCSQGSAKKRQECIVNQIITNVNLANVAAQYSAFYAPSAEFHDPLADVTGLAAIIDHVTQGLQFLASDEIDVTDVVHEGNTWITTYTMKSHIVVPVNGVPTPVGEQVTFTASTVLKFDCNNKVVYHRDYYDQFPLYQQIPNFAATVQGMLFQYIGSLLGHP